MRTMIPHIGFLDQKLVNGLLQLTGRGRCPGIVRILKCLCSFYELAFQAGDLFDVVCVPMG